ncbi:hypothetical protein [Caballeronia udeis]|jgi:hypothetical protein|uniref:hypothetical protein n=1 Tax=Caballeronia udeis TaxID=1232866 RepID=UPI00384B953C
MNIRFTNRLTRAAVRAARPAGRGVVRALRHHSARTQFLAGQFRKTHPVDGIRSWFHGFFSNLRLRAASRQAAFKALLRKPAQLRAPVAKLKLAPGVINTTSRRPRRLSTSDGWFAFAAR